MISNLKINNDGHHLIKTDAELKLYFLFQYLILNLETNKLP